ncbi:MAG: twin-arginine translocase subunit TatC [Acidimicrobiales bacterium]
MAIRAPRQRAARADRPVPEAMTLVEHLKELRRRIILAVLATVAAGILGFAFYGHILNFLVKPFCDSITAGNGAHLAPGAIKGAAANAGCNLQVNSPLAGLGIRFKLATYSGIFLASPVILWQIWRFITPGLNPKEKRYAVPFITSSIVLFCIGATIAYLVAPTALGFLGTIGGQHLTAFYLAISYINFILGLMVAFGLAFELPIVLICLELAGVLSPATLVAWRRKAIVIIFVLAAVFIPSGDPFSLFAMAIPMCLFYEGAIIVGKVLKR